MEIENNNFYENIFNAISDPVIVYDLSTRTIIKVNQAVLNITSEPEETLIDLPLGILASGRDGFTPDVLEKKLNNAISNHIESFEWEINNFDNGYSIYDMSLNISKYNDMDILILIAKDITKQKQVEKENTQQSTLIKQLMKNIPGIFYMYNSDNELIMWNENHSKLLGYSDSELHNKNALSFFAQEDVETISKQIKKMYQYGEISIVANVKNKAGRKIPYLLNAVIYNDAFMGFGIDISELLEARTEKDILQQQLMQTSKLEAIGSFSSKIVHDLNNLIGGIKSITQVLNMKIDINHQQDLLETLDNACDNATRMLEQILIFTKKENVPLNEHNLADLIPQEVKLLQAKFGDIVNFRSSTTSDVNINSTQLHQILMNICKNAYESMDELDEKEKKISISITQFRTKDDILNIEDSSGKTFIKLTIEDNGCGMSDELKEKVFDCFYTTKQDKGGSGLGLASVLKIIKYWNGYVSIESILGFGTSFTILIPAIT